MSAQNSSSRPMRRPMRQYQISTVRHFTLARLNISFSVQIRPSAPAAELRLPPTPDHAECSDGDREKTGALRCASPNRANRPGRNADCRSRKTRRICESGNERSSSAESPARMRRIESSRLRGVENRRVGIATEGRFEGGRVIAARDDDDVSALERRSRFAQASRRKQVAAAEGIVASIRTMSTSRASCRC